MTYKDLNVYQRAYKVAIDLHLFLQKNNQELAAEQAQELKTISREILAQIAEGSTGRTPRAKRYFYFRAREGANRMMQHLEFLHDIKGIPEDVFKNFSQEYEVCSKQLWKLNQSVLEKSIEKQEAKEAVPA